MDRGMDDGARRHGWSPWNYCDYCGEKGEDRRRGDRLLSSNGIPGTRTKSSQLRGWGVARPSPRWDSTLRLYIYICVCVRVYWSSWTVSSMGRDFRDRENILKGEGEKVARRQLW